MLHFTASKAGVISFPRNRSGMNFPIFILQYLKNLCGSCSDQALPDLLAQSSCKQTNIVSLPVSNLNLNSSVGACMPVDTADEGSNPPGPRVQRLYCAMFAAFTNVTAKSARFVPSQDTLRNRKFWLRLCIGGLLRALRFPILAKLQIKIVTNCRLTWDKVSGLWLDENVGCANESHKWRKKEGK